MGVDAIMSSVTDFNKMEVVKTGIFTTSQITVNDAGAGNFASKEILDTISHSLGYSPIIIAYVILFGDTYTPLPYGLITTTAIDNAIWIRLTCSVDATNVYFFTSMTSKHFLSTFGNRVIKYYLLKERQTR